MKQIDFSIIIPTWNRSNLVRDMLVSLYKDRKNYQYGKTEVLIIDSSVGDEQESIILSCKENDAIYVGGENSVRKKRNKGIELAQYEYVLFIDSDVTIAENLLNEHAMTYLSNIDNSKIVGAFGLTEFVGKKRFWWNVLELTSYTNSFSFAKKYEYVSWTLGNNVSFKRDVLLEVGMFEEGFPYKLGGDDLDLSYRITKAGYLIKTVPNAITYHSRDTWNTWKAANDRTKRWGTMEYYVLKRHPELVQRRLPMTGDVVLFISLIMGILSIIKKDPLYLAFLGGWYVLLFFMMYINEAKDGGKRGLIYWGLAKMLEGKYRFHRLLISLKKKDLSLVFKGQFFGIYHVRDNYKETAKKTWLYYISIFLLIFALIIYKGLIG